MSAEAWVEQLKSTKVRLDQLNGYPWDKQINEDVRRDS